MSERTPVTLQAVSTAPDKGFDGWSDGDFIVISKREGAQKSIDRTRAMLAAPDLLVELKGWLNDSDGWSLTELRKRYDEKTVQRILRSRAAIAKAEGTK